jgi:Ca-activated chloride channel family protein
MSFFYPMLVLLFIPLILLYLQTGTKKELQTKLLYFSLAFCIIAIMRPVVKNKPQQHSFHAQEYIIAIDASYSMQADDIQPSRFIAAKNAAKELMKNLNKDRFSIFIFTSNALLISPPTTDTSISINALESIDPHYILTKATSLLNLFKTVQKIPLQKKKLIIFTDGGEEYRLQELLKTLKKNTIVPYIVATASTQGSLLKKGGKTLLDDKGNLVVSRINPILQPLATQAGGAYFHINDSKLQSKLTKALKDNESEKKKLTSKVYSFQELFYYPLFLGLCLFVLSVTRILQLLLPSFFLLLLLPYPAHAEQLLDFFYKHKANQAYKAKQYKQALDYYEKVSASPQSYYNKALVLYRLKHYRDAALTLAQIETKDPQLKQKVLYTLGNCAVKLHKYNKAKIYYKKALGLGEDSDAKENLKLLYLLQLKEKKKMYNSLKKEKTKQRSGAGTKSKSKKSSAKKKAAANTNKNANAGATKRQNTQQKHPTPLKQAKKNNYKLGYKAYELINKGYTNETRPW